MRGFVLCADDFGLAPGVSRGIAELAEAGRLSALGCMPASPDFVPSVPLLAPLRSRCDIGLHVTLTGLAPLGSMPELAPGGRLPTLGALLRRLPAGRAPAREIAGEVRRQLDRFRDVLGRDPDFIDGHQHVHVLPGVRDAVLGLFEDGSLDRRTTWVRDTHEPLARILRRGVAVRRAAAVSLLGLPFHRLVQRRGLAANAGFAGVNDFSRDEDFGRLFRRFLAHAGPRPLVMCHPGHADEALLGRDPVIGRREDELAYLAGPDMPADLAAAGLRLRRMAELD